MGRKPKPIASLTNEVPDNLEIHLSSSVRFQTDKHPDEVAASPTVKASYFRKTPSNSAHYFAIVSEYPAYPYYYGEALMPFWLKTDNSLDEVP